jgi:hypothetical protein
MGERVAVMEGQGPWPCTDGTHQPVKREKRHVREKLKGPSLYS